MGSSTPQGGSGGENPHDETSRDSSAAHVRVLGTRLGRYVEFEYSLGDGTLAVELILPFTAFEEFRAARHADLLTPDPAIAEDLERLAWKAGRPGLLRRVDTRERDA